MYGLAARAAAAFALPLAVANGPDAEVWQLHSTHFTLLTQAQKCIQAVWTTKQGWLCVDCTSSLRAV